MGRDGEGSAWRVNCSSSPPCPTNSLNPESCTLNFLPAQIHWSGEKAKEVDFGLLILRIGLGCVVLFYGCQKMLGLFGGAGFAATVTNMGKMGFPSLAITLSIFAEFFGALGVLLGTPGRGSCRRLVSSATSRSPHGRWRRGRTWSTTFLARVTVRRPEWSSIRSDSSSCRLPFSLRAQASFP